MTKYKIDFSILLHGSAVIEAEGPVEAADLVDSRLFAYEIVVNKEPDDDAEWTAPTMTQYDIEAIDGEPYE
jgi:hypothetical protein